VCASSFTASRPTPESARRFAPHQLRHAHAVELAHEGVALNIIQRQLGHANLGTTSIYLQGIDTEEIIAAVHGRSGAHDVRHRRTSALTTTKVGAQLALPPTATAHPTKARARRWTLGLDAEHGIRPRRKRAGERFRP